MVGRAFQKVAASGALMTKTVAKTLALNATNVDSFTAARIGRDRDRATARYLRDRDVASLQATMTRLDVEEQAARDEPDDAVTPAKARDYLANLWKLWQNTEPEGQRAIAEAAFDRIDALGLDLIVHPSAEAERYGWSEAFGSEPLVCSISRSGRGERSSGHTIQLSVRIEPQPEPNVSSYALRPSEIA
jgi:hypothetical protein